MRKHIQLLLIFFTASICVCGCKSTGFLMAKANVVMINEAYPAKSEDANIDVYITNTPTSEYIELAQITCNDTDDEWSLNQIKIKAREIGADAIIIMGKASTGGVGVPIGNTYIYSSESYGMRAVAIKYK